MTRPLSIAYRVLLEPQSKDDDGRRREFILNVLLVGSLVLSLAALANVVAISVFMAGYGGEPPAFALAPVALFGFLFWLSRSGHLQASALLLVATYLMLAFGTLAAWGIDLPEGVLILSLAVVMASVLLGTRYGLLVTAVTGCALLLLAWLQQSHALRFESSWMQRTGNVDDAITLSITLAVISTVSWLSNRETERSLARANLSEAALKRERDLLETKVTERTQALELAQRDKVTELSRFAEFGRLTSNVIHELVTPLTTVSLNLEKMHDEVHSDRLKRALASTRRMERYVQSARKQLSNQSVSTEFLPGRELASVVEFLTPEAQSKRVRIDAADFDGIKMYGNPVKFHQLATNLLANAISAYAGADDDKPSVVSVDLRESDGCIQLSVQDWGVGIPARYIGKVFDPFFTLKNPDEGMGIGLSLCKNIAENEFGGTIMVMSDQSSGTTFTARLPQRKA